MPEERTVSAFTWISPPLRSRILVRQMAWRTKVRPLELGQNHWHLVCPIQLRLHIPHPHYSTPSLFIHHEYIPLHSFFTSYFVHHLPFLVNPTENEVLFIRVTSPLVFLSLATTAFQRCCLAVYSRLVLSIHTNRCCFSILH